MRANGFIRSPTGLWVPDHDDGFSPAVRAARAVEMLLAGTSVAITAGSGTSIAGLTVGGKIHQLMGLVDQSGHIWGSKPTYFWLIPSQVHVNSANTVHWDMFNADAALVCRVLSILQIPNITTAVTGVVFDWLLERTTSVGTSGTGLTAWLPDSTQTALDADITARSKPTGGAAQGTDLRNYSLSSEETNAATIQIASQGGLELIPTALQPSAGGQGILLRQNEGLRCVQITASAAGNTGWLIGFTVE